MSTMAAREVQPAKRRAWPPLLHRLVRTVRARRLFESEQHLLVSVSGGPDSVALLSLLHQLAPSWRLQLTVAHFNYGLRGEESEGDQEFVTELCRRWDVPLVAMRLRIGDSGSGSLQAAARELRYHALESIADERGANRIALAHTADDQAETVLLWLLRGSGLTGLSGMPASRDGRVVRPLYDCSRSEVLSYLDGAGLSFRTDSTNAKPLYARNRVRHEILPALRRIAPGALRALSRSAELCREDDRFLNAYVTALCEGQLRREQNGSWVVDRDVVRRLPRALQRRILRELFRRSHPGGRFPAMHVVEEALRGVMADAREPRVAASGFQVTETKVRCPAERPTVAAASEPAPVPLPVPSAVRWPGTGQTIRIEVCATREAALGRGPDRIIVDRDLLSGPLVVRAWRAGDRFYPAGLKGRSKKLQDFFTDLKVPVAVRRRIPLVAAPDGIVWVVGYRQDARWAPTPGTRRYLIISVDAESCGEGVS